MDKEKIIHLNGERRAVQVATLSELLTELKLDDRPVAIELNGEILPRSQLGSVNLSEGDQIEVVQFVGGG